MLRAYIACQIGKNRFQNSHTLIIPYDQILRVLKFPAMIPTFSKSSFNFLIVSTLFYLHFLRSN